MPRNEIKTTGQLREFLADMIVKVKEGNVDLEKARHVTKLASQINESFYSEIKTHQVLARSMQVTPKLGNLILGKT